MFILKSKIQSEIAKVQLKACKLAEIEWKRKMEIALDEQKNIYELLLQEKNLEIESLNNILDQNKQKMIEAGNRELNAKKLFLRAQEVIRLIDYEFKRHLENNARSMSNFDRIRHDTELFSKQMFLNK